MSTATVYNAPPGIGKTTLVAQQAAHYKHGPVEFYVPTHALAAELNAKVQAANPQTTVRTVAGRSHFDANNKPLCKKHKLAKEVARVGGEVYSSLCARKKGSAVEQCRYYNTCPYIAQFKPAQVTIYTHSHLPLRRSRLESGVPDIAVIDESFFQACIEIVEVPIALLRAPFLGQHGAPVCAAIEAGLQQALPLLAYLGNAGMTYQQLRDARDELSRRGPTITPRMGQSTQRSMLQQLGQRSLLRKLLDNVAQEIFAGRRSSHGLLYDPVTAKITVHCKKPILRFDELRGRSSRVLIIDGSADKDLIEEFFSVRKFVRIRAPRHARVVQVRSTRCSTTSLVPKRNADRKSKRAAKQRLGEVEAFVARLAARHVRLLVVGPQAVTGNTRRRIKPLLKVPANVDLAHFNAIRGIDRWKNHDAVVVIGRNEPPIKAVEAIARCVYLNHRDPLHFADTWTSEMRGYRLRRAQLGVDVVRHPDLRVQKVLEQLREEELVQAIDRLRLVHAATPKYVYVLSNLTLDIDVDDAVTWEELMHGSRLERAWDTLPGVMPLAPAWLATRFPHLWATADAAKADVARASKECQFANSISIRNLTLFEHPYRPVNSSGTPPQRVWSKCLSLDADSQKVSASLEALLGFPVKIRGVAKQR